MGGLITDRRLVPDEDRMRTAKSGRSCSSSPGCTSCYEIRQTSCEVHPCLENEDRKLSRPRKLGALSAVKRHHTPECFRKGKCRQNCRQEREMSPGKGKCLQKMSPKPPFQDIDVARIVARKTRFVARKCVSRNGRLRDLPLLHFLGNFLQERLWKRQRSEHG